MPTACREVTAVGSAGGRLRPWSLAVLAGVVLAAGCGSDGGGDGGGGGSANCSETARKEWVLTTTRDWYHFEDLLPATVDLAQSATAEALLDILTASARAEGKDRFFSYITTRAEDEAFLSEGEFIGFGLRTRTDPGPRVFLSEVFEGSPASDAGLGRGDEIIAVDSGSGFVATADLLASGETISDVLGPAETGVERGLRIQDPSAAIREVSLVKRTVAIDPVPDPDGAQVLPLAGTAGVGYINLRTYISAADDQLRTAFGQFRAQGIDYFIVDLRYNGGGLITTYELLGDLLGGGRGTSDVMARTLFNSRHAGSNGTRNFRPQGQSVTPVRVAFLTTEATASASELNINTLRPWIEVAIVGSDTFGKPVGQNAFDFEGCDDRMRLVTFRTVNALDEGDFFDGLAPTMTFACAAADNLTQKPGDPDEGLTAAALDWLATGTCGSVITAAGGPLKQADQIATRYPRPARPSAAQVWLPGAQ